MGWNPINNESYRYNKENHGMPDFTCDNNIFVDAKGLGYNINVYHNRVKKYKIENRISLTLNQLLRWTELCKQNKKIYLMLIDNKYKNYEMYLLNIDCKKTEFGGKYPIKKLR